LNYPTYDLSNHQSRCKKTTRKRLLTRVAEKVLEPDVSPLLSKGLDIVGDIAIVKLPESLVSKGSKIGQTILDEVPYIKVVLNQITPVSGEFRTRKFDWLAGEKRTITIHKEYGCQYKVDLKTAYFSPRLSHERMRIAELVKREFDKNKKLEVVTNLFAGVGCFSILIAKHSLTGKIYSIDINPDAIRMMKENVVLNRVAKQVIPILGDARKVVESNLKHVADRVLMPLPEHAIEFLDTALTTLKPEGGWLHYQDFAHARKSKDSIKESAEKFITEMDKFKVDFEIMNSRVIRDVGPHWFHITLDVFIK